MKDDNGIQPKEGTLFRATMGLCHTEKHLVHKVTIIGKAFFHIADCLPTNKVQKCHRCEI